MSCFAGRGKRTARNTSNAYIPSVHIGCQPNPAIYTRIVSTNGMICLLVYLTVQLARSVLMKPKSSCLFIEAEQLVIYPLHGLHSSSTYKDNCLPSWSLRGPDDDCSARIAIPEWGWKKKADGNWKICWTTLPEATKPSSHTSFKGIEQIRPVMQVMA